MHYRRLCGAIALSLCALSVNSYARIKLISLPVREHIEIQLENEHTTIIEEERIVPLKKGRNSIDFSWQNTAIKPETIVFRVLPDTASAQSLQVNVLSVSYPPNESALTWQVSASQSGSARVRISYAILRLEKQYHYLARVNADETAMELFQYIRVNNQSGEQFLNAGLNTGNARPVQLSVGLNETQEYLNQQFSSVPVEKTLTVNASAMGFRDRSQDKLNVLMHYRLHNDASHKLGKSPLAAGKYRIYQQDKQGGSVFIGEDQGQYTAVDDSQKLFIGKARDVVVRRIIERKKRKEINGNLYNMDVLVKYEIENFKDTPVTLTIEESLAYLKQESGLYDSQSFIEWQIGKDTSFKTGPLKDETSADKVVYEIILPAKSKTGKPIKVQPRLNILFNNLFSGSITRVR